MDLSLFISDYQKKLAAIPHRNTSSSIELIKSNLQRLSQIERQLLINTYRFVFIGEPGGGKTTTICNYMNLTKEIKQGDKFTGFELFDTASGRTTAFEVHFLRSDITKFVIHTMDISKQKALIREYCEYNWRKVFKSDDTDGDENDIKGRDGCSESDRIIRNMLGFTNDASFQEFLQNRYDKEEYETFLSDMLDRINVESRTCNEISYHGDTEIRAWLKSVFNDINFGKRKDTGIPEQVDVYLNNNDLDFFMPDFVSEVIDTRGYDGGAREDLRTYIRSEDTLSVILDKVESLPGERQRKILSEWVDSGENDIINRISLMIKDRDGALSRVNEANDDNEVGENIKREELSHSITDHKLHYNENNTIFIDSYEGISLKQEYKITDGKKKPAGKSVTDYDQELRIYERDRITNHFLGIIRHHKEVLADEAKRIRYDTEQLYHAVTTASEIELLQEKLKETENRVSTVKDTLTRETEDELLDGANSFCGQFRRNTHWASARKTASTAWQGTWYKAEVFEEYMDFCESSFKKHSSQKKEQIIGYINCLSENNSASTDISSFVSSCITRIELEYRQLIEDIRVRSKDQAKSAFDYGFWEQTENVSRGTGYYDRLIEVIRKRMLRTNLCVLTSDEIQKSIETFFNKIIIALQNESHTL